MDLGLTINLLHVDPGLPLESFIMKEREWQDVLGRWFYPSQKFRIIFKNILVSRKRFFLGLESGGDFRPRLAP